MLDDGRRGSSCGGGAASDGNGYAEVDPTGRYGRLEEVLGRSATKTVYRAFDEVAGMEVAWNQSKLSDVAHSPEVLHRLHSEVVLLGSLCHDSIIRFHTSWVDPHRRTFNFITELLTSGTLRQYRRRYPCVDVRAVKRWARQILAGLVYLHGRDQPVIHRDLKCDNIFVNGHNGCVKIGDLGLAAVIRDSQPAHSVIGTPEFMAPELYDEEYNELVDIYSFGMCVIEMLTSEYPYSECSNPAQIYKKVTSGKLPDAFYRVEDPEARRFIGRCLEKASERPSAKELLLDPFLSSVDAHHNAAPASAPPFQLSASTRSGRMADLMITGKVMNPLEDGATIALEVRIADKDGNVRNVHFPFDFGEDTPMSVAKEMVQDLEITGRDPSEIAGVIEREIAAVLEAPETEEPPHEYNYKEDMSHPFYCISSSSSSNYSFYSASELPGSLLHELIAPGEDDEAKSSSCNYSDVNYTSSSEPEDEDPVLALRKEAILELHLAAPETSTMDMIRAVDAAECSRQRRGGVAAGKRAVGCGIAAMLIRNRSMEDLRSQLLQRSLLAEINKRLYKTVGAVENIGFRLPRWSNKGVGAAAAAAPPLPLRGDAGKKNKSTWGRR